MADQQRIAVLPGLEPAPRKDYGQRPGGYLVRGTGHHGAVVDRNPGAFDRVPAPRRGETGREKLMGLLLGALWEVARRVPEPIAFGIAELGGAIGWWFGERRGLSQIRRNLALVVAPEELDGAVRRAYRSGARSYVEAFRAADIDPVDLDRRTTSTGFEHLDAVLEEGRGAVALLAHHGTWDTAARWAESRGIHLACVAEVLRPRSMFRRFVRLRESIGLEIVPLRRSASLLGRLEDVLAANHLVGLLSDRDLSGAGPVVSLFGVPSRIPAGPVLLSQRSGAAIVPITMLQRPRRRWHVVALEPVRVDGLGLHEACQKVADAIEQLIRLDPAQWHAFQPIVEADRPPRRRRVPAQTPDHIRHGGGSGPEVGQIHRDGGSGPGVTG